MNTELRKTLLHHATILSKGKFFFQFFNNPKFQAIIKKRIIIFDNINMKMLFNCVSETMTHKMDNMPKMELVKLATSLFEIDWIKLEYTNLMMNYEREYVHPDVKTVVLLMKKIITHSRTMELPSTTGTRDEFETLIENMCMNIFDYLKNLWFKLEKFDRKTFENALTIYINNLIWTNTGRLDYEMMVNKMWEEKKFPSEFTRFYELSVNSFEEKLKAWYAEVKKTVVDFVHRVIRERCKDLQAIDTLTVYEYDYYLLAYWHYRIVYGVESAPIDDLIGVYERTFDHSIVDNDGVSEGNMLALCAYYGHHISLKYFWNRMSNEEKNRFFIKTLAHMFDRKIELDFYGTKTETITFLMKTMNVKSWEMFLEKLYHGEIPLIMLAVIMTMPYREFNFPTMDILETWIPKAGDMHEIMRDRIFSSLVTFLKRDHELTRQEEKIKELIPQIFRLAEYKMH